MAKAPRPASPKPAPQVAPAETPTAAVDLKRWLQMTVGMSGPRFSVSPGDKHPFDDVPPPDGGPSEAQRLIDAGFAVETDPPADA